MCLHIKNSLIVLTIKEFTKTTKDLRPKTKTLKGFSE